MAPESKEEGGSGRPLRPLPDGRYTGFTPLGEGGMGVVYLALDTELNRRVAFKMIRTEGRDPLDATPRDTEPDLEARFLQEAWVAGGLEHPGIVPVYELGRTPSGVPYYTMRLIRGERTLEDAIVGASTLEDRLALLEPFLKACDAMRYAHSRGVIHRDLKPANIALGPFGEVVVLDWGLARAGEAAAEGKSRWQESIDALREESAIETRASPMGTPGYMAPEAALGDGREMDARSDIYSLGAILCRILTGELPFPFEGYQDYLARATKGLAAVPGAPAGLEAICLRALAPERADRYADVGALARDVRAWQAHTAIEQEARGLAERAEAALEAAAGLEGDALLAQVDRVTALCGRIEQVAPGHEAAARLKERARDLRRTALAQRERAVRSRLLRRVGVAALLLVTAGAVVVSLELEKRRRAAAEAREVAETARKGAEEARAHATTERNRAEQLANFMLFDLRDGLEKAGRLDLMERVARRSLEYYERPGWQESVEAEYSRTVALNNVGMVLLHSGDLQAARRSYEAALEVRRRRVREAPDDEDRRIDLAVTLQGLGAVLRMSGDLAGALACQEEGLALTRASVRAAPHDLVRRRALVDDLYNLAQVHVDRGDAAAALRVQREVAEVVDGLVHAEPDRADWRRDRATALYDLADAILVAGADAAEAGELYERAVAEARGAVERAPRDATCRRALLLGLSRLGRFRMRTGDVDAARVLFAESETLARELVALDPSSTARRSDLADAILKRGDAEAAAGDLEKALAFYRESEPLWRRIAAENPDYVQRVRAHSVALQKIGVVLMQQEKFKEAAAALQEMVEVHARALALGPHLAAEHEAIRPRALVAAMLAGERAPETAAERVVYGTWLLQQGRHAEAAEHFAIALEDPAVREDLEGGALYNGACAAANVTGPDAAKWQDRAMEWLAEDLRLRRARPGPDTDAHVEHARVHDPDLAPLRARPDFADLFR